jgi:hypothetical protein
LGERGGEENPVGPRWGRWSGGLERKEGFWVFFQTPFQTFKFFSNLNTTNPIQIILKTFKTSHKQTINTMQPKYDAQALIASKIFQK